MTVACRTQGICSRAMRRWDRGTKKRLRPMSEPKTERSSARLSWLLPRVWMEAEESMRKRGSWSAKLRVATRRAAMMPRAAATAAAKASLPQGERAQAGSRPRRTGTRRRARRKGSSASSSAAARGREKRASKPRATGGRSRSAGGSSRIVAPLFRLFFATPEQGRENRRFDYSVASPVDWQGNATGIKGENRDVTG